MSRKVSPLMRTPTRHYRDRREAPRLATFLRTDCCRFIRTAEGLEVFGMRRAVATDLSATGVSLTGAGYLKLGTVIKLFLRLPDVPANPVVCYGRVVRADQDGRYGLRLTRLRDGDQRRLTRFVRVQLARQKAARRETSTGRDPGTPLPTSSAR